MKYIIGLILLLLMVSCGEKKPVIEQEYIFENDDWKRSELIDFNFSITKNEEAYKVNLIYYFTPELEAEELRFQTKLINNGEKRTSHFTPKIQNPESSDTIVISPMQFFNSKDEYKLELKNLSNKVDNPGFKSVKLQIIEIDG